MGVRIAEKKSSISLNVLLKVTEKKIKQTTSAKMKKKKSQTLRFFRFVVVIFFLRKKKIKTKREWVQWSNNNYQAKMSNKDHQKIKHTACVRMKNCPPSPKNPT